MKNKCKLRSGNKTSFEQMGSSKPKDNIGEGFMQPPYKKPVGPTEKAKGYHGYKNFKSNISNVEHDDQSKESARKRGELCAKCDNRKGNCICPSPAKAAGEQVVDGQLCDAYGNPKPSKEQVKAGLQSPNFSNKAKKGKGEKGLGPGFEKNQTAKKEETIKKESNIRSGKKVSEEEEKAKKEARKQKDMDTMNESIDAALGK